MHDTFKSFPNVLTFNTNSRKVTHPLKDEEFGGTNRAQQVEDRLILAITDLPHPPQCKFHIHFDFPETSEAAFGEFLFQIYRCVTQLLNGDENRIEINASHKIDLRVELIGSSKNQTAITSPSIETLSQHSPSDETVVPPPDRDWISPASRGNVSSVNPSQSNTAPDPTALEQALAEESSVLDQARLLQEAFAQATEHLVRPLENWLKSLEGQKFNVNSAKEIIAAISTTMESTGRRLCYEGQAVTIHAKTEENREFAGIQVTTIGKRPQEKLRHKSQFGRFSTLPINTPK